MVEFTRYYGRFQGLRGNLTGLQSWARLIVAIFALPGLILLALSILAFVVSLLALLLLTVPVYRILQAVTTSGGRPAVAAFDPEPSPGRKQVDVRVVE